MGPGAPQPPLRRARSSSDKESAAAYEAEKQLGWPGRDRATQQQLAKHQLLGDPRELDGDYVRPPLIRPRWIQTSVCELDERGQ